MRYRVLQKYDLPSRYIFQVYVQLNDPPKMVHRSTNIPYINGRLEFYSIIESLDNYKNTKDEERLEEVREKIQRLKEQEIKMKK
ncbi:hypothetical protein HP922_001431 [Campylobacter coli]|nr:hypothetical protein [Campylobacter coli]EHE0144344.1 hypothetical protein [Campylobacter coli]EHE0144979.1 hypothetical protein [Campylobacter coli]EHV4779082.1 hypothetical protein [Campylobacter coli]EHV4780513.1 hypothetical protein [Campylobacter coli]